MDSKGAELILSNPGGDIVSSRNKGRYVDNTALGVDGRDDNVVERITRAAQQHERTLYATGGKLALNKCMWVLVNWIWTNGDATMATYPENEKLTCTETAPDRLVLEQSKNGQRAVIPRLNPNQGYRTLGIWIAASGCQQKQLEIMEAKVSLWLDNVKGSLLNALDKQLAYKAFLRAQIHYPLGCSALKYKDAKKLFRPVLVQLLHTLGLNKNFPLAMVHAGLACLGLEIDNARYLRRTQQSWNMYQKLG